MRRGILCMAIAGGCWLGAWCLVSGLAWGASSAKQAVQAVTAPDFEQALFQEISRRYARPAHKISLQVLYPKQPITVPKGNLHIDVDGVNGGRTGRRAFRVQIFVSGQFIKTVNVVAELKGTVEAVMPVRWIRPKEILSQEDMELVMIEVPSLTHDLVLGLEEAVGKQVLRSLPPKQAIRKNVLDHPPLIRKGDRVRLEVRSEGLLVQTVGLAKAAGKQGETIPVKNQSSGREVVGTVMASGLVEVRF